MSIIGKINSILMVLLIVWMLLVVVSTDETSNSVVEAPPPTESVEIPPTVKQKPNHDIWKRWQKTVNQKGEWVDCDPEC